MGLGLGLVTSTQERQPRLLNNEEAAVLTEPESTCLSAPALCVVGDENMRLGQLRRGDPTSRTGIDRRGCNDAR
jgi:hypothetical protein